MTKFSFATQEQIEAFAEMERLLSGARRSAKLAFPDNDVRRRSEFQVGIHQPADFASEIERAGKVHAACLLHAEASPSQRRPPHRPCNFMKHPPSPDFTLTKIR